VTLDDPVNERQSGRVGNAYSITRRVSGASAMHALASPGAAMSAAVVAAFVSGCQTPQKAH
jgi:hypothetical protein